MKLNEITMPSYKELAEIRLQNAGYTRLGKGMTGMVFAKPDENFVLKLFDSNDDSYIEFLSFCSTQPNNPNLPKFKSKLIKVTDHYYAIRMERLEKINSSSDKDFVKLIDRAFTFELMRKFQSIWMTQLDDQDHNLAKTIKALANYIVHSGFNNDIDEYNVMKRGDTFVITDPIC